MKNNLIRGVRKASDFLMALQLTGASRRFARQPAGALAGAGHRRRPDRDRHRHRAGRLLPGPGREVPDRWEALAADAGGGDAVRRCTTL